MNLKPKQYKMLADTAKTQADSAVLSMSMRLDEAGANLNQAIGEGEHLKPGTFMSLGQQPVRLGHPTLERDSGNPQGIPTPFDVSGTSKISDEEPDTTGDVLRLYRKMGASSEFSDKDKQEFLDRSGNVIDPEGAAGYMDMFLMAPSLLSPMQKGGVVPPQYLGVGGFAKEFMAIARKGYKLGPNPFKAVGELVSPRFGKKFMKSDTSPLTKAFKHADLDPEEMLYRIEGVYGGQDIL